MDKQVPAPYAHQQDFIAYVIDMNCWACLASPGTGKSKMTLLKAEQLYREGKIDRMLVFAPKAVLGQWAGEVMLEHWPFDYVSHAWGGMTTEKEKQAFHDLLKSPAFKVFTLNYESVLGQRAKDYIRIFLDGAEGMIILDESTKAKNPKAKRTKILLDGFRLRPYKGILSGTISPNGPLDLYSQYEFLVPGFWGMTFFHFSRRYQITTKKMNPSTGRPFNAPLDEATWKRVRNNLQRILDSGAVKLSVLDYEEVGYKYDLPMSDVMEIWRQKNYSPFKNMAELRQRIDTLSFRANKEDCLDLPQKVFEKLDIMLGPEQKRVMKELKSELMTTYHGQELTAANIVSVTSRLQMISGGIYPHQEITILADGTFSEVTKYSEMSDNPKLAVLMDDLETIGGEQCIIWSNFRATLELLHKTVDKAGYVTALYYGSTSAGDRERIEREFKSGEIQVLIINPAVGDMGLNFQNSNIAYYYDNVFQADRRIQSEDRQHRVGQNKSVLYKDLVCKGSIDEKVLHALKSKTDVLNYFSKSKISDLFS